MHDDKPNWILWGVVVFLLAVGAYFITERPLSSMNNASLLDSGNATEILTDAVRYADNATGYYARPAAEGVYPGVVMIHENRGLRPEIKAMAEQLAKEGYQVLAVDLFAGRVVETQEEARAITATYDQAEGVQNLRAAAAYLREQGAPKIASLGWCFGGRQSVALATSGEELAATVVYYGSGIPTTTTALAPIRWPVLGIFGEEDQAIPVATVRDFERSLTELGVDHEIVIYPGVGHAFANPSGANYAPEETRDAWQKTLGFLKRALTT